MESSIEELKKKGDEAFDLEDFPTALKLREEYLESLQKSDAENKQRQIVEAHLLLAKVYCTSPYYINDAVKQYDKAANLAGEDIPLVVKVLVQLAKMLYRAAKPDAALSQFESAIQLGSTIKGSFFSVDFIQSSSIFISSR